MGNANTLKVNCWVCHRDGLVTKCCSSSEYYSDRGRIKCEDCEKYTEIIRCPECRGEGKTEQPNAEVIDLDEDD